MQYACRKTSSLIKSRITRKIMFRSKYSLVALYSIHGPTKCEMSHLHFLAIILKNGPYL